MFNIPCTIFTLKYNADSGFMGYLHGNQLAVDNITKSYGEDFNATDSSIAENFNWQKGFDRLTRTPFFITGLSFAVVGFYEVITGLRHSDNQTISNGLNSLAHSVPFLGVASSQYVKDADPKLLNKQPFWKTAYDWAREKVSSLTPQPAPAPVPVQAYGTLENCIQAQPQ
ncbi:hypothetical protein HYU22_02190 [Candidatus Woesearchaeota archaeon]|nr:hypothetical protein [Candidatus Woesearchaeota archaeon]